MQIRALFRALSENPVRNRIAVTMFRVSGLMVLAKFVGAGRDLVLAGQFGTSGQFDAYLIAFLAPTFATNVIGGSVAAALIPVFIQIRESQGRRQAQKLLSTTLFCTLVLLLSASVTLALTYSRILPLIAGKFDRGQTELTVSLFYLLLPTLFFNGMSISCGAVLNASNRFTLVAVTPLLTPVLQVGLLLSFRESAQIYAIAIGTASGSALEFALIAWALQREGFSLVPRWRGFDPTARAVLKQYLPAASASVLMCSTVVVDQSMATMLGKGSVSALAYGMKVVGVITNIGPTAMSTVLLPHFAFLVAAERWSDIRQDLKYYTRAILAISLPLTLLLVLLSPVLVRVLFERGAFTPHDTVVVSFVQQLCALQIPFYMVGILIVRMLSSMQANQILLYGTVINVVVNAVLNYVFMAWLGAAGIALSTSAVYCVSYAFLSRMLWRLLSKRVAADYSRPVCGPALHAVHMLERI
jgi:putative peptidoglycan lipid II flippase